MGADALDPLKDLLASPNPNARTAAARQSLKRSDFSEVEQDSILARLHEEFAPMLREMQKHDPDPTAQGAAQNAPLRMAKGWGAR